MHNIKFIRQRFPNSQHLIIRVIFGVVVTLLAIGVGLTFLMR